jgi:hypothetical protein
MTRETIQRVVAAKLTILNHKTDTIAPSGRQLYHLQFSLQTASPETFGYILVHANLLQFFFHNKPPKNHHRITIMRKCSAGATRELNFAHKCRQSETIIYRELELHRIRRTTQDSQDYTGLTRLCRTMKNSQDAAGLARLCRNCGTMRESQEYTGLAGLCRSRRTI